MTGLPHIIMTHISVDGQNWLTAVLDPYHDYQIPLEGIPDALPLKSYVRVHNQIATVSATADDDQIAVLFNGLHGPESLMAEVPYYPLASAANIKSIHPVSVIRSTSGTVPTYHDYMQGLATKVAGFRTALTIDVASRLVAVAIEVRDVTQDLYKKGTSVSASMNGRASTEQWVDDGALLSHVFAVTAALPSNTSELQATPGSVTMESREGAYLIPRFREPGTPAKFMTNTIAQGDIIVPHLSILQHGNYRFSTCPGNVPDKLTWNECGGGVDSGFQPCAIWFSGLSENSVLTVTVRTIVEYFPDVQKLSDLSIATSSPRYEPAVFTAYHSAITRLPCAVPVRMNAKGDWWRMVKKVMLTVAPHALKLGPLIGAGLAAAGQPGAGAAVTLTTNALGKLLKARTPQKQVKRKSK